jgi:hypothetical protein
VWGGPPGPQPTPTSARRDRMRLISLQEGGSRGTRADQGSAPLCARIRSFFRERLGLAMPGAKNGRSGSDILNRRSRGAKNMAASWGLNTLASGASAGWSFSRPYKNGFLPVLSVEPQSGPDQSPGTWTGGGSSYPTFNKLVVSTSWSNQSDAPPGSATFLEADL